jgi:hypothetical protein
MKNKEFIYFIMATFTGAFGTLFIFQSFGMTTPFEAILWFGGGIFLIAVAILLMYATDHLKTS